MAFLGHYRHLTHLRRVSRRPFICFRQQLGGKHWAWENGCRCRGQFHSSLLILFCTVFNIAMHPSYQPCSKKIDTIICILGTFLQNFKRNEQDLTSVQSLEHSSLLLIWLVSCFVMQYLTQFLIFLSQILHVGRFSLHQNLYKIWVE